MNILFLCTSNVHRSRTAELFFKDSAPCHKYISAGLSEKYCAHFKTTLCTEAMLDWADEIFVMEAEHIRRIKQHTGRRYLDKVVNLDIPDVYDLMDERLIKHLQVSLIEKGFEDRFLLASA